MLKRALLLLMAGVPLFFSPAVTAGAATLTSANAPVTGPFTVVANRVQNSLGEPVFLHGVDWPSLDWSCDGQHADGASSGVAAAEFSTMRSGWHSNAVRIPLNQDLWLPGAARYCPSYAATIKKVVGLVEAQHMVPILDLHSSDGGNLSATSDDAQCMADVNSLAFWKSVAAAYRSDPQAMFELYNEPHDVPWSVWRNGGRFTCTNGQTYMGVGMQQLADAVRAVGASNVVIAGGNDWAGDLAGAASRLLNGANIAYAIHPYSLTDTVDRGLWDTRFGNLTALAPVVATEFGRSGCPTTYRPSFDQALLAYFHAHGMGYTAWGWWVGGCSFPSVISDEAGTCFQGGCVDQADMASLEAGTTTVSVPTPPNPKFGFANGTQGWSSTSPAGVSTCSCAPAYRGAALRVPVPAYSTTTVRTRTGVTSLGSGSYLSLHVYAPPGSSANVSPSVVDVSGNRFSGHVRRLRAGWNTLTYGVPSISSLSSLDLTATTGAWSGDLRVDDVAWTDAIPAPRSVTDFEDGTTDGWSVQWGSTLSVANTSTMAYRGSHALAVDVSGTGYPAIATRTGLSGLAAGRTVTFHVYAPAGASISVQPWVYDATWSMVSGPANSLVSGWNTVTWQIPAVSTPSALGLQINDSSGWQGRLAVDAVTD